jgi:hypothetical protein
MDVLSWAQGRIGPSRIMGFIPTELGFPELVSP